jgi:hypothetical protein
MTQTEARTAAGSGPDDCAVCHSRASETDPVRETIDRAAAMIEERYALSVTLPRLVAVFERAASGR